MSLIPMNVEQMRRKALENSKAKLQQQKDFKNQVDNMSRHDVGGLYDVRQIMKSKQFKEQKNHYNIEQARSELEDLLQANRLYKFSHDTEEFIKKISGRVLFFLIFPSNSMPSNLGILMSTIARSGGL